VDWSSKFKGGYIGNNSESFMISYEMYKEDKHKDHLISEIKGFIKKTIKRKDIEWLENNGFTEEIIKGFYPDYTERRLANLYLNNDTKYPEGAGNPTI
jgi:hypothetical protein